MSGKFYYNNSRIFAITLLAGLFGGSYLCVISGLKGLAIFIAPVILIISMLLAKIPCTYRIDGEKLILRDGLTVHKLDISEIQGVRIDMRKNGHNKYGGTYFRAVLVIESEQGEIILREDCGIVTVEDIMKDPACVRKKLKSSKLNSLSNLISAKIRHNDR